MNEHDAFDDQDHPEVRRRLRSFGSAPLRAGVAEGTLDRIRSGGRRKTSGARLKLLSAAALVGFAAGGVGLAAADVLPAPVQDVAHNALDAVGMHVPPGHNRYNDPTVCPGGPYANHGAYVRAHKNDPNAGASPCGKPVQSVDPSRKAKQPDVNDGKPDGNDAADATDNSAGNGPPPWAHDKGKGKPDKGDDAATPGPTTNPAKPVKPAKPATTTTTPATSSTAIASTTTSTSKTTSTTTSS